MKNCGNGFSTMNDRQLMQQIAAGSHEAAEALAARLFNKHAPDVKPLMPELSRLCGNSILPVNAVKRFLREQPQKLSS